MKISTVCAIRVAPGTGAVGRQPKLARRPRFHIRIRQGPSASGSVTDGPPQVDTGREQALPAIASAEPSSFGLGYRVISVYPGPSALPSPVSGAFPDRAA